MADWHLEVFLYYKIKNAGVHVFSIIHPNIYYRTYKYKIEIYWSEADECFIAEVPELSGCMADGETPGQALYNVEIIIGEWLEKAKELG